MKMFRVVVNGSEYKVGIEELPDESAIPAPKHTPPKPIIKAQSAPAAAKVEPVITGGTIIAPMPGTVLHVEVNVGDAVIKGQTLLILEAMKMENEIMAPADGVVHELNVTKGVSVNAGEILVVLSS